MKKFFVCVMGILAVFLSGPVLAKSVKLAWNPNSETNLSGYKLYYGSASGSYEGTTASEGTSPILLPLTALTSSNSPEFTVSGLSGGTFYIAVTAYNSENLESGFSNEVQVDIPEEFLLDASFSASDEGCIDSGNNIISVNLDSFPADPKTVFWQKNGLIVNPGQVVEVKFHGYYTNGSFPEAPVIFYLADEYGPLSRERIPFLDSGYGSYVFHLVPRFYAGEVQVKSICGLQAGYYEFQKISVSVIDPEIPPIEDVFLEQLLPSTTGGKFMAQFRLLSPDSVDGRVVRVATSAYGIEMPDGVLLQEPLILAPGETTFSVDIGSALYNGLYYEGFYTAVSNLIAGMESAPVIYPYLPGNILGHPDEANPPLSLNFAVMSDDYNWAYQRRANTPVPVADGTPACYLRRANNRVDSVISSYDLSFISFQRSRGAQMLVK
jgi:hypothetical protein